MAVKWRYGENANNPLTAGTLTTANSVWFSSEFGDDGNPGTPDEPLASLGAASQSGKTFLIGNGYFYNETMLTPKTCLIGDGILEFRNNIEPKPIFGSSSLRTYNAALINQGRIDLSNSFIPLKGAYVEINSLLNVSVGSGFSRLLFNVPNPTGFSGFRNHTVHIAAAGFIYTTVSCSNAIFVQNGAVGSLEIDRINTALFTRYSAYINNLPIKITGGGQGSDEAVFSIPTDIENLRNRAVAVYGGQAADYFPNCRVLPPTIFNDDYSLNTSPEGLIAATMSDNFSFVGAKDIALQWKPGTVDYINTTNLTLDSGEYKLADTNLDGNAISVIKTFGKVRELKRHFFEGVEAPLNGQVIDSTQSWGPEISPDTGNDYTGLIVDDYYTVFSGGGVTYNGTFYSVGQTFKVVTGVTTATDDDGTGSLRKQLEAPNKKNMRWRFSKGGALTSNIAADRVDEDWMYVLSGSINDGTTTYNVGDVFKYDNGLTYSGTYQLQFIFNDSEPWKEMEISGANNLSVDSAGRGNGDPDFDYASEEGVQAKYVQHQVVIESDNNRFLLS